MLTFESVRDVERAERENKKLQRLPAEFFDDLQEYLRKKKADAAENPDEIIEYQNIMAAVERLFERRERKILEQALDSARTDIPPENIHGREKHVFEQLSGVLSSFRREFFASIKGKAHESQEQKLFRIKKDVPEFIGPDMKTYKLRIDDVVSLPEKVGRLLIEKGSAEEVK